MVSQLKLSRKAPLDLIPSRPLRAIARVMGFGVGKHGRFDWRAGSSWSDNYAAAQRHLLAWNDGEDLDPETGESHLAHAACRLLFLLEFGECGLGVDDRYNAPPPLPSPPATITPFPHRPLVAVA